MAGVVAAAVVGVAAFAYADAEQSKARYDPGNARIDAYVAGTGPNELNLFFVTGQGDIVQGPSITEEPGRVVVGVRTLVYVPPRGTFKNLVGILGNATITLREPLGARVVVDAATQQPVKRQ